MSIKFIFCYFNVVQKTRKLIWVNYRTLILIPCMFCLLVSACNQTFAQVSNYSFQQLSGTYTEITGGAVLGTATANNYTAGGLWSLVYTVNTPFPFNFNGYDYSTLYVHSTGYITFGTVPTTSNYLPISTNQYYAGAICAWDSRNGFVNIGGRTSELRWEVVGTAPNREIVIQWKDFRIRNSTSTANTPFMNYQIRLHETTNIVDIVYGETGYAAGGSTNNNHSAQVGLRGGNFNDFNNRTNASSVSINSSQAGAVRDAVQNYSSLNATPGTHSNGKIYRWIPASFDPPLCDHPDLWGTINAPNTCTTNTITNIWAGQYSIINNVIQGNTYQFSSSNSGDWLALTDVNTNELVSGFSPLVWTATFTGTVHLHVSQNEICNTDYFNFRNTFIECLSCCNPCNAVTPLINVAPADCNNPGTATITNFNVIDDYIFNPTGPSVDPSGVILNLTPNVNYTVIADDGNCESTPSTPFSIAPIVPVPAAPTTACYETATFNTTSCEWEITGTQPTQPTATNCWDDFVFDNTSCSWVNNGSQPTQPTATNCWDDYQFDSNTCTWVNNGAQPTQPTATNCWDDYQFDSNACTWVNNGSLPTQPTATNCWDDYQFDGNTCSWVNNGAQPTQPTATNCWDDYQFNTTTCAWVNNGSQPTQPTATNCWDDYQFDSNTCSWVNNGAQPTQPTATNCWDDYQFDNTSCSWVNNGSQPAQPSTACYETATFNTTSCEWEVNGSQPTQPTPVNCWDNFVFDNTSCTWQNTGSQPAEPTNLACYQTATFDAISCAWNITGDASSALSGITVTPSLTEIIEGQSIQLTAEVIPSTATVTYEWWPSSGLSCSDCANPIASPSATTTYTVIAIDENGCEASTSVTVLVAENCPELFIPTIFSPNGDGNNDTFCVLGGCISSLQMSIYNRWGEVVFRTNDPTECWDGKFRGEEVNTGVFVHKTTITLSNGETKVYGGNITLVK